MINLTIDGKSISVPKGTTVFTAAKQLKINIPIFCYQDRMPPFGACRMCLVEVEKMPKLQTSCTLEATEGMVVKTQSTLAVEGRKDIIEFLLINHPLDCPICDRGGECPLQEQALTQGPGESRFFEEKRHFEKPIPLGPVLMLDRERCIICARCTRFGDVVAGDHALELIDRGYRSEVGTPDRGPAESKFIGNTIMICPVGALTSNVYRFRARPWDNDSANSSCTLCPVGCSMILDSRDGEIVRTRSQENRDVNDIWLCDKGWFGYEYTYNPNRLQQPLMRRNGELVPVSWENALSFAADKLLEAKPKGKLAGFGGHVLTVEENYLFQKLMREGAGVNHLDYRIGMPLHEEITPGMEISIGDCENLSLVYLLGLDLTEEFPVVWLRLRQAINKGAKVVFAGHYAPEIAKYLSKIVVHAPGQEWEMLQQQIPELKENGKKASIFIGRQYLNNPHSTKLLSELFKLREQSSNISLNIMEAHGNSMGAKFAGMHPNFGPLNQKLSKPGLNYLEVLEKASKDGWDYLYLAGCQLSSKIPTKLWKEVRSKLKFLIVQDLFLTETAKQADLVLPTFSYVEKQGTFINIEGRLQRLFPGKEIPENIYSDAEIFTDIARRLKITLTIDDQFGAALKQDRLTIPRQISISSSSVQNTQGKLMATFAPVLFDHGVRMKHNPHVIQLSKEPRMRLNLIEGAKRGIKEGDFVRVSVLEGSITGKVKLDARVAPGTIVLPLGFDELPVHELGTQLYNGMTVDLSLT